MGRNASLDEFVGDDGSDERGRGDGPASEDVTDTGLSTFDWSPNGAPCAACQDQVKRRWRDNGRLVCESCKEW